ncbi:MAG: hypothetical protein C0467_20415 [Planctomycetaceae bacterium]|nr:hypothetical protein [Planctomycetaceae bacterium]
MHRRTLLLAVMLSIPVVSVSSADDESLRKASITLLKEKTTEKQADESLIKSLSKPTEEVTKRSLVSNLSTQINSSAAAG